MNIETKRCSTCHETKPVDCFYRDRSRNDGLSNRCKGCITAYANTPARKARLAVYNSTTERKAVRAAYNATPARKAYRAAYKKTPAGKACQAAYQKKPEVLARRAAIMVVLRRDPEVKAKQAAYQKTPVQRARRAAYQKTPAGKACQAAYQKKPGGHTTRKNLRLAHPKRQMLTAARNRAKRADIPCTITTDDFEIPTRCPVLGIPLTPGKGKAHAGSPTLDKIIPELGYIPGNIEVISYRANTLKRDASAWELFKFANYYLDRFQDPDLPLPAPQYDRVTWRTFRGERS